jgi:hypothetical protein
VPEAARDRDECIGVPCQLGPDSVKNEIEETQVHGVIYDGLGNYAAAEKIYRVVSDSSGM